MDNLRKKGLLAVWIAVMPFCGLCQLPWILSVQSYGWPDVKISQMDSQMLKYVNIASVILSNLPDMISIVIFLTMLRHFRNKVGLQPPPPPPPAPAPGDGGIWMGGNNDYPLGRGEVEVQPQQQQQPNQVANSEASQEQLASVMRALKCHAILSLVDLAMVILGLFVCGPLGNVIPFTYQIVCCYWIPFLVVKSGFKQLDNMAEYLWTIVCLNNENIF